MLFVVFLLVAGGVAYAVLNNGTSEASKGGNGGKRGKTGKQVGEEGPRAKSKSRC